MGEQEANVPRKHICAGLLAHVDAGKTTLAESILYQCGSIRRMGRVDHGDAFLDTFELERARGITIFSKQACLTLGDREITLLDTPGHVDFSAEMERTLQVLDYAVLVISGADGVQGHVETLWRLLRRYGIPVFLFINKMDQAGTDREKLLEELKRRLDDRCVDFGEDQEKALFNENLAMCDEELMESYLDHGSLDDLLIGQAVGRRTVFPCYFGSALRQRGVEELLEGLKRYTVLPEYPSDFGARVFKIARDEQGMRLTHLKVTGGMLRVKDLITNRREGSLSTEDIWEEKADQIRMYSGAGYVAVQEAVPGTVCAVTGLGKTYCGQGLGCEKEDGIPLLEPVLTYEIKLPEGCDVHKMLGQLKQLEEEEPQLHIVWNKALGEIHVQVMGEVQMEVLKSLIRKRFGVEVEFGAGSIVYKETIAGPVEGIGHFEPLKHYAEVHLLLEPAEAGSGLQFSARLSEDELDRNWQRLILTHLEERKHPGVLTGSEITDMKITLVAGRSHLKHTEGGDFRQATYRAVRQGLRCAKCVLLEPVYEFTLEVPTENTGRAMSDIQRMHGRFHTPHSEGDITVLSGCAPAACMRGYQKEVTSYTRGRGHLVCILKGYEPCHNTQEVIDAIGYDCEADTENPTGSVFCAHGAGFVVSWDQVKSFAHVESGLRLEESTGEEPETDGRSVESMAPVKSRDYFAGEKELEEIFVRTYGPVKRKRAFSAGGHREKTSSYTENPSENREEASVGNSDFKGRNNAPQKERKEYLLVDGYNIIFAWEELRNLADGNIDGARGRLMDILSNYQGYAGSTVILVFDAYKVKGNPGEVMKYHNIYVVYTKEAETADQYIEKTVHEIGKKYHVTVATSDALEQMIIWGQGASRMSAMGLKEEVEAVAQQLKEEYMEQTHSNRHYPFREFSVELEEQGT